MKTRFLISTAVGLVFATAAFGQSPNSTTTAPTTTQTQTPTNPSTTTPSTTIQKAPDTSITQTPTSTTTPNTSTTSPQAQTPAPATSSGASQPTQAQTNPPAPATGQQQQAPTSSQAQQAPGAGTANTSAQPSTATNNAQSSSTNVNASININDQQRTRVSESITRLNVQPVNNVNFSLTVGTAVPRDIHLQTLPADVVEVVPQYRGYSFFVVRDEIVIVEPSTYQIVTVLPRNGGSTATAPAPARSKVSFTDKDRDVVRKHVKTRTTERQTTTGSAAKVVIRRGERLPETVEFEEFPDTVYREAPALREYRYIHRENRTYLVDPRERTVIEEID